MKITQTRIYKVTTGLQQPVELMFMNRKGGFDTLHLTKYKNSELDIKPESFTASGVTRTFRVDSTTKNTYYSTYLNTNDYEWLKDLALSTVVLIDGKYVKVLSLKGFELDNYTDIWSFEITVSPEYGENKITF